MLDKILLVGLGYVAGQENSKESSEGLIGSTNNTVDYAEYVSVVETLNEARVTMANLILANSKLTATLNELDPDDTSRAVYEAELTDLQASYDLLYNYVEKNVESFTPNMIINKQTVDGLVINPNVVFDRSEGDINLYIDANDCIAVRGITSHNIPVSFAGNTSGVGYFKSSFSPNEPAKHMNIGTSYQNFALRVGSEIKTIQDLGDNNGRINSNHYFDPWIMIEFDPSVDLHDFINTFALSCTNQWDNTAASTYTNNSSGHAYYQDRTVVIPYRKNVLLVRPAVTRVPNDVYYGKHIAPLMIWDKLKARQLLVNSCAVLNLPIGDAGGRPYHDTAQQTARYANAFAVAQKEIT